MVELSNKGMRLHDIFFWSVFFFLLGIFLSSLEWKGSVLLFLLFIIFTAALFALIKKKQRQWWATFSMLAFFCIPGALYQTAYTIEKENTRIPYNTHTSVQGIVSSNPERKERQEFKLKLLPPKKGNILVQTTSYPEYSFGETLTLLGKIQKTKGRYGSYLEHTKDIRGISYFPKLEKRKKGKGVRVLLFSTKNHMLASFRKTLPYTESAFLSGITLGEREEFADDFKEAMSKSGTTHLVALSGYNITILTTLFAGVLTSIISRKKAFWVTIIAVIAFVLMTGAESSVVRAAIMGIIAAIAPLLSRVYAPRNSIALAALGMALWNPNVLLYDLGFQLSFLALIGIVYLAPALLRVFRFKNKGFLNWKENFLLTLSAQIMVTPLLVAAFGSVSATSLLSNILILEFIPFTMFLGLLLGIAHIFSQTIATLIAWITLVPLKLELGTIKIFSVFTIPLAPVFTIGGVLLYYLGIIFFIWRTTNWRTTKFTTSPITVY